MDMTQTPANPTELDDHSQAPRVKPANWPKWLLLVVVLAAGLAFFGWQRANSNQQEQQAKQAIAALNGLPVLDANQQHVVSLNLQLIKDEATIQQAMRSVEKLPHLEILDLSGTAVGDEDLVVLRALRNLHSLHLNDTQVTSRALPHIASLRQLQGLHLAGTAVTDDALGQLTSLEDLIHLDLSRTAVGKGLAQLAPLPQLRWLLLIEVSLDPPVIEAVKQISSLERLTVGLAEGESARKTTLKKHFPGLSID